MPLTIVATPIGHPEDITVRTKSILENAEVIIGEEAKPTRRLLKSIGVSPQKTIELLNEHSSSQQIEDLTSICQSSNVALVSDCGTPGFCDPGANLVKACRENDISVKSAPGASSLMTFLSLCGERIDQFWFEGFLPANTESRKHRLGQLKKIETTLILMDTPYRLLKTLDNCEESFSGRTLVLGTSLTQETESILTGSPKQIKNNLKEEKAEFVLAVLPPGGLNL